MTTVLKKDGLNFQGFKLLVVNLFTTIISEYLSPITIGNRLVKIPRRSEIPNFGEISWPSYRNTGIENKPINWIQWGRRCDEQSIAHGF